LNVESTIDRQRFQYLSDNLIPGGGSALFGVAAIIFVFKDKVDDIVLFTWAGAAILVSMLRILLRPWVRRNLDNPHRYPMIERRLIIVSAAAGVLWGISFILLALPEDMFYWLFLVFLIGGYAAGSVFTTSASLPASAGYLFSAYCCLVVFSRCTTWDGDGCSHAVLYSHPMERGAKLQSYATKKLSSI